MKLNALTKMALVALAGAALTTSAYAQGVLLTVDISNPSAVIVSATGNYASTSDNLKTVWDGIDLLGIFTSNVNGQFAANVIGGTLIGGGSGQAYDFYEPDDSAGGSRNGNYVNLNLYQNQTNSPPVQSFSTETPAFTGSMTIDLSRVANSLPASGTSGDIRAGWSGNLGSMIGQWQVIGTAPVPEPGTLALTGLGGVGAWFCARRKK